MDPPRSLQTDDLPQAIGLLDQIFRLDRGITDQSVLTDFPLVFDPANRHRCLGVFHEGRVVSHAAVWPRTLVIDGTRLKAGIIVLVATLPEYRRRGLAAALMRELEAIMRHESYDLGMLWTGVPDFYHRLGWETVEPRGWIVEPGTAESDDGPLEIVDLSTDSHLDVIQALHEDGPVHTRRTAEEFERLLELPKLDISVAIDDRRTVGYLVTGRAVNKRGLIEYAGDTETVWRLVNRSIGNGVSGPLIVFHPHEPLARRAESRGWTVEPLASSKGFGAEMILVLNPAAVTPAVRSSLFVWGLDQA